MKILPKLIAAFLVIAILVTVIGYLSLDNLSSVGKSFNEVQYTTTPKITILNDMKLSILFLAFEVNEVTVEPSQEYLEVFELTKQKLATTVQRYQIFETEDRQTVTSIQQGTEEIIASAEEIIELKKAHVAMEVLYEEAEEFNEKAEKISNMIDSEISKQNEKLMELQLTVSNKIQSTSQLNFIFTLIALSLALGMGGFIARSIHRPLIQLKNAAKEITEGNHDVEIKVSNRDEIGELATQFNIMRQCVKKTNANLTQLVKMRTSELEKLNETLKGINDELVRKDKLKDEFISIASHELRTPVQPILGFVELAKEGRITQTEAFDVIAKNAIRLQHLANNILDASIIESGQIVYRITKVSINDVIRDVINARKVNLNGDLSLITDLDGDVKIDADKERIAQVFTNLIDNALKFTKRGTIKVETKVFADKNQVVIKVADTGTGISDYIIPNLFNKFVTSSDRDRSPHGTGLGLFISKGIVAAHKGEISACNNSEGGATFTVVLPIDSSKRMN